MKRSEFQFDLPATLIAQHPLSRRADSRLLCVDRNAGNWQDRSFADLPELLEPGDLLVFNDTRVIPARLYARKASGGKVEILIERVLDEHHAIARLRASKPTRPGTVLYLEDGARLVVGDREGDFIRLQAPGQPMAEILRRMGHVPLPPYIQRSDEEIDRERYQTVYAERPGAIAAPTAGLHFDEPLLDALERRGIRNARVTLHIGAGTFQPVRCENVEDHRMHAEYLEVSEHTCAAVRQAQAAGRRVIAVGTTTVRSLETAATARSLRPFSGDSRIFIYPGFEFRVVDGMITNFHLPESTLLMLVSAFAGTATIRAAYAHAIQACYRFYSYGDAMLIL